MCFILEQISLEIFHNINSSSFYSQGTLTERESSVPLLTSSLEYLDLINKVNNVFNEEAADQYNVVQGGQPY